MTDPTPNPLAERLRQMRKDIIRIADPQTAYWMVATLDEADRALTTRRAPSLSAQEAAPPQPTREQIARECYAVGEFDEAYGPEKHDQWWNEDGDAAGLALQYIELADRIRALFASPSQPQQKEVEG